MEDQMIYIEQAFKMFFSEAVAPRGVDEHCFSSVWLNWKSSLVLRPLPWPFYTKSEVLFLGYVSFPEALYVLKVFFFFK